MDQLARKRPREDPEAESSVAKKRSFLAVLRAALAVDKEVVKSHGQWRDASTKDSRGAPPGAPADGVEAVVSAWAADLCDKTLGKKLSIGAGGSRLRVGRLE